jgi:lipoprotein-anchoring transpeptidase ErfK/SrfK
MDEAGDTEVVGMVGMARIHAMIMVAVVGAAAAGCTDTPRAEVATNPTPNAAAMQKALALTVTPADRQVGVPVSAEIGIQLAGGSVDHVKVTDAAGHTVAGELRADGSGWVPSGPLRYQQRYTATVTAVGGRYHRETREVSFTTMAEPRLRAGSGLYLLDGQEYGVAMPIAVEILHEVPANLRASVQRRFFVKSDPPQPGAWHWTSGTAVQYRPATYWQPGTKLSVRIGLEGVPLGGGYYGDQDRRASARIAKDKVELNIANASKRLQVFKNGKLIRTIPVSMGKPSTPTSSGHMVIMEKASRTIFDTLGDPNGGYRVAVDYAQRLTWGGEYLHSAPWSVGDQGYRNVSHGCTNLAPGNAFWLFQQTHVGDPVTITGTEVKLRDGNGWTMWDLTWQQLIAGSALPVPPDVANATAYDPYPAKRAAPSPTSGTVAGPGPAQMGTPAPSAS